MDTHEVAAEERDVGIVLVYELLLVDFYLCQKLHVKNDVRTVFLKGTVNTRRFSLSKRQDVAHEYLKKSIEIYYDSTLLP
ncbi:hypothetical protein D3C87_2129290 [compost metagenome]